MAKKKPAAKRARGRPKSPDGPAKILFTIKGRGPWGEWVKGIALGEATNPADLFEQAVSALAVARGYPKPPPRT